AFLCMYMVFNTPPSFGLTTIGLLIAGGAFWAFFTMYRGTQLGIEMTDAGLFLTDGTELAAMDKILKVDRGTFSVKPTNGFTLILKDKAPFAYVPGLYWRTGRKLGIGGVTAPQVGKFMAEQLAMRITQRDA
ncbi:MAG: hypothetical protein ACPG5U_10840, partial [Planktomarina sp.]